MKSGRVAIVVAIAVVMFVDERRTARADHGPGTLMQWGYGEAEGGPDLSEPIVTDRPDFTESSVTVGVGVVQLEGGYTFTYNDDGNVTKENSFPELLLRAGVLADWLELRVGWNWGQSAETIGLASDEFISGAEDLYLGLKIGLTPQCGCLPETAIMPQMTVPSGSPELSAHEVLPGVNYLYGWDVNDFFSMGGSTQANRAIDENGEDYYVEVAQSITTGYSLTEDWGAFAEWFMFAPCGAETAENQQYFNSGLTYLITDNIQWDIRAGVGLNEAADDFFAGSGLSVRLY